MIGGADVHEIEPERVVILIERLPAGDHHGDGGRGGEQKEQGGSRQLLKATSTKAAEFKQGRQSP